MTIFLNVFGMAKVWALLFALHPIHVSVTEIEHDEKDKELEIMMRVFIDDMELTIRNHLNQPELDILHPENALTIDQMTGEYLKSHFNVRLDGKLQKATYLGHERDADAFVFYIEVSNVRRFKTIEVFNDVITETHEDQNNLVHITVKDKVKSLRLTRDTPVDKITFDQK